MITLAFRDQHGVVAVNPDYVTEVQTASAGGSFVHMLDGSIHTVVCEVGEVVSALNAKVAAHTNGVSEKIDAVAFAIDGLAQAVINRG